MNKNLRWWISVSLDIVLLLIGQTCATLLNRYYYDQGGNCKWIETLTFSAAFSILYLPLLFFTTPSTYEQPDLVKVYMAYLGIGLFSVADSLMYSYTLLYLSVSTYSLLCSTQLAFNAVFSYFINKEKFTYLTLNSVVLLSCSTAIIGLRTGFDSASVDPKKSTSFEALVEAAEEKQKENSSVNGSNGSRSFEDFENDPIAEVFGKEKRKNYYREISSTSTMKQVCHHREVMNGERVVWVEKVFDPEAPIYEAP